MAFAQSITLKKVIVPDEYSTITAEGRSVILGDVDEDGYPDLLFSLPQHDGAAEDAGAIKVLPGRSGKKLYEVFGSAKDDALGMETFPILDVNGDNIPEFYSHSWKTTTIRSRKTGAELVKLDGRWALTGIGDYDGDAVGDYALGQVSKIPASGDTLSKATRYLKIYSGKTQKLIKKVFLGTTRYVTDKFRINVQAEILFPVPDMDGDGKREIAVGMEEADFPRSASGAVIIYGSKLGKSLKTITGSKVSQHFGAWGIPIRDVTGDNIPDLAIGDYTPEGFARFNLFSGRSLKKIPGSTGNPTLDFTGDSLIDFNLDGKLDYVGNGKILTLGTSKSVDFPFDVSGLPLYSFMPDADGDGIPDLLVAVTRPGTLPSALRLLSGKDGSIIYEVLPEGVQILGDFNKWVVLTADMDGDNSLDFIISDLEDDSGGENSGAVRVYSGKTGEQLRVFVGPNPMAHYGSRVELAGDVTGDHIMDVLVYGDIASGKGDGSLARSSILVNGATGEWIKKMSAPDFTDRPILPVADFNGDGCDDYFTFDVVGPETIKLTLGCGSKDPLQGETKYFLFDYDSEPLGDLDNDGAMDFQYINTIWSSKLNKAIFESAEDSLLHFSKAGDINGDGQSDLWSGYDDQLYLFSLSDQKTTHYNFRKLGFMQLFETWPGVKSYAQATDFNSDGISDIFMLDDMRGPKVRILSGKTGELIRRINGKDFDRTFSQSSSFIPLGDTDGDGTIEALWINGRFDPDPKRPFGYTQGGVELILISK